MTATKSDSEPTASGIFLERLSTLLHWRGRTLALILLGGLALLRIFDPAPLEPLRLALFDALHVLKPRVWRELPIIIVDIDEESLARHGQWPWPRYLVARLIDQIAAAAPEVIGIDIIFAEADRLSPDRILSGRPNIDPGLQQSLAALESNDTRLAKSLAAAPSVLGIGGLRYVPRVESYRKVVPVPVFQKGGPVESLVDRFPAALQSLPELDTAAGSRAALNVTPEPDGIIRRVPLVISVDKVLTPTLTVEMLRRAIGAPRFVTVREGDRMVGISVGGIFVPTEPDGRVWVNFTEPKTERFVSAADVLAGDRTALQLVQRRLVLLGSSALGLVDSKAIPGAPRIDGIEIHAMLLESMLSGELLIRPLYADFLEMGLVVATGLILIVLIPLLKPRLAAVPFAVLLIALLGGAWIAHDYLALRIDTSFAAAADAAVFAVLLGASLVEKERLRRLLQIDLAEERAARARTEGELAAARRIQLGTLPSDFPAFPEHVEFDLYAVLEPARAVGGDLYDFAMLDENHLFFIVGDVSGKGIPAALFMALTKALYKSSALRRQVAIAEIMTEANMEISRENPELMFVTVLAGILDIRSGAIEFCNAGHDPSILLAPGQTPRPIDNDGGPPLCVLDDFEYPRATHNLNPGEAIVLYTDGITEAMNGDGELYTADRMVAVLSALPDDADCARITRHLYDDIQRFVDGTEPSDDVTILTLRYLGPAGATG